MGAGRDWDGASTKQIFADYTEYVALGVSNAGKKMFATAVVFLPGDTLASGVGSAELKGVALDPIARFAMSDREGKHVAFCKGEDAALHLVWRMQKVRYARFDGSAWSSIEGLGGDLPSSAELLSCAVDAKGRPHVAWLRWQDTVGARGARRGIGHHHQRARIGLRMSNERAPYERRRDDRRAARARVRVTSRITLTASE